MPDPTIKRVLEVAVNAALEAGDKEAIQPMFPAEAQAVVAAAIAAFLEALPGCFTPEGARLAQSIPPDEDAILWIAAAVRRAAGGGE